VTCFGAEFAYLQTTLHNFRYDDIGKTPYYLQLILLYCKNIGNISILYYISICAHWLLLPLVNMLWLETLYADDFAIYHRSQTLLAIERQLQLTASWLSLWSQENGFKLYVAKTTCIHFSDSGVYFFTPSFSWHLQKLLDVWDWFYTAAWHGNHTYGNWSWSVSHHSIFYVF
jgi:hypothetical protein